MIMGDNSNDFIKYGTFLQKIKFVIIEAVQIFR